MRIHDAHLHIGNISDTEVVSPREVREFLTRMGVEGGLAMPVALRGGGDNMELHQQLYKEAKEEGFEVALYVNKEMLATSPDLSAYWNFPFKAIKIHPDAVRFTDEELEKVRCAAIDKFVPLMIHTGADDWCRASRFESLIKSCCEMGETVILCHARPAEEAFMLLNKYANVWIDTAHLSLEELRSRLSPKNERRILFGSDFPTNRWFPHLGGETDWYKRQVETISQLSEKVIGRNYELLLEDVRRCVKVKEAIKRVRQRNITKRRP